MEGTVQLTIAIRVQAKARGHLAGVCRDGSGTAKHRKSSLGSDSPRVRPGAQHRGRDDRSDTFALEHLRAPRADNGGDRFLVAIGLRPKLEHPLCKVSQHCCGSS